MTAAYLFLLGGVLALQAPPEAGLEADPTLLNSEAVGDPAESLVPTGEPAADPEGSFGLTGGIRVPEYAPMAPAAGRVQESRAPAIAEVFQPAEDAVEWEAAFAPQTWPIWALVLVGFAAMIAGFRMAALLRRQIRAAASPRLHVDGIRFTGLVAGSRPVFFVRVGNSGPSDAYKVAVSIGALYQGGGGKAGAPQTMTIPAHSSREFFVRWQNALTTAVRDDILGGSSKLCVKVAVEYGDGEPHKHCYQYHPWEGDRPPGVPDFVPCDLDSQLGGFTTGRTARLAVADDVPLVTGRKAEDRQGALVLD